MISRLSVALWISIAFVNVVQAQSVGRTPGQFDVSASGSAEYSIPIWAPPGPRGVQPHVALTYNSSSGNGPEGVGWNIAGLGSVTRCTKTFAQDGTPGAIALATADGYCLDGKRLRLTGGTYGTAGSTYQTEIADFSQIAANGAQGNGPSTFTVQGKDGLTYQYGNGGNSQVLLGTTAVAWMLNQVSDRAGNTMTISYCPATPNCPSSSNLQGMTLPATISWTPSTHGSSSYNYTMQFSYSAVSAPPTAGYIAGSPVLNSYLLNNIQIENSGTTVKNYVLGYTASTSTARETLTSIKECADAGATNCLLPTTITYQNGTPGIASPATSTGSGATNGTVLSVDMNGDGLPDLVFATTSGSNYQWWVQFATATGYGTPINTGAVSPIPAGGVLPVVQTDFLIDNFDATGGNEILAAVGSTWYAYKWNGASFIATSTGISVIAGALYASADVDGDGRPDLVYSTPGTLNIAVQLNTSTSSAISFVATPVVTTLPVAPFQLIGNNQLPNSAVKHYDFDGDGRQDLIIQYFGGKGIGDRVEELLSRFPGAFVPSNGFAGFTTILPVNWNDDSCTDLIVGPALWVSQCNGSAGTFVEFAATPAIALDWDGDGRTDALANVSGTWELYQSTGSGSTAGVSTGIPVVGSGAYFVTDKNADGLDDLAFANSSVGNAIYYGLHNGAGQRPDLMSSVKDGYGNSASPTYVPLSESNYTEHYIDATFPDQDYIGPMYVVSKTIYSDPSSATGTTYNQTFSYYGAWINLQGRGFEGFGAIETLDSRSGLYGLKYYSTVFPFTGMQYQEQVSNGTFNFSQTTGIEASTTLSNAPNQQRYFPYFNQVGIYKWEVGGSENADLITTTNVSYTYDNYGNATNTITTVTDNDPGSPYNGVSWSTDVINTTDIDTPANQSADLAAWCLTTLDEQQIIYESTLAGATTVTRTQTYTPDTPTNCRIKTIVTEPTANSGLYKVTEALTFDSFGNIHTDTVTGANMPSSPASRLTTLNWGTTGQFLTSVTDPSSAVATANFTSNQSLTFGVPDSVTNPNNLTTSWTYDAFGRKSKETRPDGTSTTWTWSTCTSFCGWSNSVYQIAQTGYQTNGTTIIRTDTNFYDPIDRVTESSGPTVAGTTNIVQHLYNSLGLQTQQSLPHISGGSAYQQTYSYDVLNRLTTATRPISSTNSNPQSITYAYAGRKVVVSDPYLHNKTIINDVNGKLRQTTDALGYKITRTYDAAGSLTGVTDSVGNTLLSGVTYNYGIKPFRVAATDADRGAWAYTIDSLGERTGWKDAKGQSFSMTYDSLSRPLTRTEPDLFSQWTYGSTPASHNVGQLISECSNTTGSCGSTPIYSETRTFDSDGRLSSRSIKDSALAGNNTGGVFLFTYGYSSTTGLPSSLTYPISTSSVALNLSYAYQNGLLQSVTDTTDTTTTCGTSCTLWTANSVNAFGEVTKETSGNGVVTNRTYDAVTSWLSAATAGVGGGATLLNQSYAEDENGNVTQRQNNNLGLTENFFYDADNRLVCATLASSCSTNTFAYDGGAAGPGNMTSQTGIGTYHYPAAGQPRPHAVTSLTGTFNGIVNPTFSYDANGNMTNRASSTANVIWTSFNYPSSISGTDVTGTETVAINYGPDRQRVQQNYTGPSGTESTFYIGGLMDIVIQGTTTNYRHYINAGSEPIAVYSRTSTAVNTMSYMLEDHQGSISTIASKTGAVDVNESFAAFGARRNPATWSGAPTTADLNTIAGLSRQGYTFQTWLGQSMGLNHMNGRVQDAILGRFLSADPHITDPSNAQNYNRYSYVNNNPLSSMDPTGFDDCGILLSGCGGGGDDGTATPGVPGQTYTDNGPDGIPTVTGTASSGNSEGTATPDVPGQTYTDNGPDGIPTITGIAAPDRPAPPRDPVVVNLPDLGNFVPPTIGPILAPPPVNIAPPVNGAHTSPCPNSGLANFLYALNSAGQGTVTAGKLTTAGAAGMAIVAAPFLLTPAAPGAAAAEGFAGIGATVGVATTLTGYVVQDAAGIGLAILGDPGPLQNTSFSVLNSIGLPMTGSSPPNITPINPFSSAVNDMGQSSSSCGH